MTLRARSTKPVLFANSQQVGPDQDLNHPGRGLTTIWGEPWRRQRVLCVLPSPVASLIVRYLPRELLCR
jgi:hypothetical protein